MSDITICVIADSPKLTSGFAQVSNQTCQGFVDAGYNLYVFGMLDPAPDVDKKLPYPFWPTNPIDLMGKEECLRFVRHVQPDIVWIMIDPGNLLTYAINLIELNKTMTKKFKIVAYPPVEGKPLSMFQATAFKHILDNDGRIVLWCQSAVIEAQRWLPDYPFEYIYFGNDHADFRPYDSKLRQQFRYKAGLDNYFMVGSFGVNKRTKNFPALIYAAVHLKEWGYEGKIKFYVHTDPLNPTMQGFHLVDMADRYGVGNMFLWKPDNNFERRGNMYLGDDRSGDLVKRIQAIKRPATTDERKELWTEYPFIAKMNCMDMYIDTSQVEGWGLPQMEAMACGVPLTSVHDCHVRDELYGDVASMMEPLPADQWETWHTGARLVTMDPITVAKAVDAMYNSEKLRCTVRTRGLQRASEFKWDDNRRAMNQIIEEMAHA